MKMNAKLTKLQSIVKRAAECTNLIVDALKFTTQNNSCFPAFDADKLRRISGLMRKEEFFQGQNIISQGESDANYYVLRRGKVEVDVLGRGVVGFLQWGMGFGEVALVLGTKRTASIRCLTPCEVYRLTRAQYESELATMDELEQSGELQGVINKFYQLCTGPDGSRRPVVDFAVYLKLHVRVSKTLTSDVEDFDEVRTAALLVTTPLTACRNCEHCFCLARWTDSCLGQDEERDCAREDWAEDMERYGLSTTDAQDKGTFSASMYQLVDLWAEDRQISYGTFMTWLFDNIAVWDERQNAGEGAWVFAKMGRVECIGEKFDKMKDEAVTIHEKFVGEEVTALAEQARKEHDEMQAKMAEEQRLLDEAERLRLEQERLEKEEAEKRAAAEAKLKAKKDKKLAAAQAAADKQAAREAAKTERDAKRNAGKNGGAGGAGGNSGRAGAGGDGGDGNGDRGGLNGWGDGDGRDGGNGSGLDGDGNGGDGSGNGGQGSNGRGDGRGDGRGWRGADGNERNGRGGRNGAGQGGNGPGGRGGGDDDGTGRGGRFGDGRDGRNGHGSVGDGIGNGQGHSGKGDRSGGDGGYGDGTEGDGRGGGRGGRGHGSDLDGRGGAGVGGDGSGDVGGGGTGGHASGHVGGLFGDGQRLGSNGSVRVSDDGKGYGEVLYTAQLGFSELLNNTLRPLKPSRELLEKRKAAQREANQNAAARRSESPDLFTTRSFKRVQALTRWPIQPLWPVDTNGAMHPIKKPDKGVRRGFRPKTDGRPASMCGVKNLFEDEILLMDGSHNHTQSFESDGSHRAMLKTPGGEHLNEVTLNGADSAILRRDCSEEEKNNSSSFAGPTNGFAASFSPQKGTLDPIVNRGVKVSPGQKCSPTVRRPGTKERNRKRVFGQRLGEGHGQFRNWRVSGAFGPREVEKLTMYNIDRDRAIGEDAMMGAIGSDGRLRPLPAPVVLQMGQPKRHSTERPWTERLSLSAGDETMCLFANRSLSSAGLSSLKRGGAAGAVLMTAPIGKHPLGARVNSTGW